jgi:hypothetical protein
MLLMVGMLMPNKQWVVMDHNIEVKDFDAIAALFPGTHVTNVGQNHVVHTGKVGDCEQCRERARELHMTLAG